MTLYLLVAMQIISLAGGQILWKKGIDDAGGFLSAGDSLVSSLLRLAATPSFLAGSALYVVATLLWFYLLARYDLSYIYPILSLTFVVASLGGWLILGEQMTLQRMAGIVVIAIGVVLITRS